MNNRQLESSSNLDTGQSYLAEAWPQAPLPLVRRRVPKGDANKPCRVY